MFSVQDFHELVRILQEHPEWRNELRRLVLADELLELPRMVQELAGEVRQLTRARISTDGVVQALVEAQRRTGESLAQLAQAQQRTEERVEALVEAQRRTEQRLEELARAQQATEARLESLAARVEELARAQQATEARLESLATRVEELAEAQRETERRLSLFMESTDERLRSLERDVAELKGFQLEQVYARQAAGYFGAILEDLDVVGPNDLARMLDKAVRDGRLTWDERQEVMWSDLVARGRLRTTGGEAYLLVEVSWGVGLHDVSRAASRASTLRKLVPVVVPAVAGKSISHEAADMARRLGVVRVTDGRVEGFPDEAYAGSS